MATQTGSYDFKAAKAAHDDAAKTASNYITDLTNDGIMVHAEGEGPDGTQTPTGWHISNVLEFIREGVSRFWIGLKNQGDATPTVRIGKAYNAQASDNESHMELDFNSLKLVDKNNYDFFYVSDLRGADGYASILERFVGDGVTTQFEVNFTVRSDDTSTVTVNDVPKEFTRHYTSRKFSLSSAPASGASVVIEYQTTDRDAKAYTFGTRSPISKIGAMSVAEGSGGSAEGNYSHVEGIISITGGYASHAEGYSTIASGNDGSHSEGALTIARGQSSHAEGEGSIAQGIAAHSEGQSTAIGDYSHSEGAGYDSESAPSAEGYSSHAEGVAAVASGMAAHAEGYPSEPEYTPGSITVVGTPCTASGLASHAEGRGATADGEASHAQNLGTMASSDYQTALGKYNVEDANDNYAAIIGNGTADNARSNALAVEWSGNVEMGPRLTLYAGAYNTGALAFASDNRTGEFVKLYGGADANGDAIVMGDGGLVVVGSGESAAALYDALVTNGSWTPGHDNLVIGSDGNIFFYPNCQTIANRKELVVTNKGCIQNNAACSFRSHSWLSILNGETAMYVPKDRTSSTMANYAVGALSIETPSGGGWTIGSYNSESLFFTYINGTERAAGRNTAYTVYMPAVSASKTICFTDHSHTYTDVGAAPATHYHNQYWDNTTSRTANTVLAAPNGSAGAPSFRKLVVADLPTGTTASTVALGNHTHAVTNKSYTGSNSAQIAANGTASITVSGTSGGTYLTGFTYLYTNHNTVIGVIGNNETTVYVHNLTATARAAKYCTVTEIRKYMF